MDETKVIEFVEKFSAKIAEAGGQGFEYLAQYNATEAYSQIVISIFLLIALLITFIYTIKEGFKRVGQKEEEDKMTFLFVISAISGFIFIMVSAIFFSSLGDLIATVQNPEGSVIKDILRRI
jgi:uncharacterized membrane protein YhaH (DUF805 family)